MIISGNSYLSIDICLFPGFELYILVDTVPIILVEWTFAEVWFKFGNNRNRLIITMSDYYKEFNKHAA